MANSPEDESSKLAQHAAAVASALLSQVALSVDCGEWSRVDFSLMEDSGLADHNCVHYVAVLVILEIVRDHYPDPWDFIREIEPIVRRIANRPFRIAP